jgi:hypothetical protein
MAVNGCKNHFVIFTAAKQGQFKCPHCGKRQRVDVNGGGSAAFVKGPFATRTEAQYFAMVSNAQRGLLNVVEYERNPSTGEERLV